MTTRWTNWSECVTCAPTAVLTPRDEAEVAAIVRRAAEAGGQVRVVGSGHSFAPLCATGGTLLSLDHLQGIEAVDPHTRQATIRAGSKIHDLGGPLADEGLALANQGDVDVQSLAGAISTGTHGTGPTLGSLSTQVAGLRLVTAAGDFVEISPQADRELFRAAQVSLGALGVVTAVRMQLVPAYRLHEVVREEDLDACLAELDARIAGHRHFEFFWYPAKGIALTKALDPTTEAAGERVLPPGERIDASWRIFPTVRSNRFNEMEYALPAEAGPACFAEIRRLMNGKHSAVTWPVEYRTLAADDTLIGPAQGRPTVTISVHQAAALPFAQFFTDAEAIFRAHGGRPHWGKIHHLRAAELATLYPEWETFQAVRRRLDPSWLFLNGHLRELFGAE